MAWAVLAVVVAYLLGSFPSGYLMARWLKGVDIRQVGDHYTGAKNVFQQVGPTAGILTLVADLVKGAVALLLTQFLPVPEITPLFSALAVVAGHIWPITLGFKDGAGAATACGAGLVLYPWEAPPLAIVAAIAFGLSRRIPVTLGILAILLPLIAWALGRPLWLILLPLPIYVLVGLRVYGHRLEELLKRRA